MGSMVVFEEAVVVAVVTLVEAMVGMKQIMTQSASNRYHLCALLLPMSLVGHYDRRGIIITMV